MAKQKKWKVMTVPLTLEPTPLEGELLSASE
jgi:hypothetical protein